MKLLINDKYEKIGLLSFLKCVFISQLIFSVATILFFIIFGIIINFTAQLLF